VGHDTEVAWRLVHSIGDRPAAVVIKHANPCGVAVADDLLTAYTRAHECDPVSAFGGIIALNRRVTRAVAEAIAPVFTEVVVAPSFDDGALEVLQAKKNLRILLADAPGTPGLSLRPVDGGYLVQTADPVGVDRAMWSVATERAYASDAFFPFPDGLDAAIEAGATAVIQPGGSIRDDEVIAAANAAGLAMVFTGERHFRH